MDDMTLKANSWGTDFVSFPVLGLRIMLKSGFGLGVATIAYCLANIHCIITRVAGCSNLD